MQDEDTNLFLLSFLCERQSNMLYLSLCIIYYILFVFVCFSFFRSFLRVFSQFAKNNVCVCHCVVLFYFFFFFFCSLCVLYSSSHTCCLISSFFFSHFFSLLFLFRQNINDDQLKYEIE